ncbi:hypothetical protein [Candidatus Thiodiazotropha sp. LNASS1]|uniref:hypothetical protein n=1 Tax=Candidatus Thiodiazotropha sp. LNASS1 TaxID=3096260 RepID=UPI0034DEE6D2
MKRRKKMEPDYAFIAIKVDNYSVRADAGINSSLLGSPRLIDNEEEPVHEFETKLEITGLCTDPEDRAGHRFEISMYGAPDIDQRTPRIKDLRERNNEGDYRYRTYRGREYLVYASPPPVAYIDKVRGENRWITWLWVSPRMVSDSLIILSGSKPVYISLHEIKEGRKRCIQNLTLQTTDPAEE